MRSSMQGTIAFLTILATCIAGILHVSWWACLAAACVLELISMSNHRLTQHVFAGGPAVGVLVLSSLLNAGFTSASALAVGRGIGWAWGV